MKRRMMILLVLGTLSLTNFPVHAQNKVTVDSVRPVVVKTVPQAGDTAVDPAITEISVTFSKDMMTDNMWSWGMISKETFPSIVGQVKYLSDKRTCVAPVSLEPGMTYAIWFNTEKLDGFRDTNGKAALPYLLVFETKK